MGYHSRQNQISTGPDSTRDQQGIPVGLSGAQGTVSVTLSLSMIILSLPFGQYDEWCVSILYIKSGSPFQTRESSGFCSDRCSYQ
jgi:hypothetical protein